MKSKFLLVFFFLGMAQAHATSKAPQSSEEVYSQKRYSEALTILKNEVSHSKLGDAAIENKINLAAELFRADPNMTSSDLKFIYTKLLEKRPTPFLSKRLTALLKALSLLERPMDEVATEKQLSLYEKKNPLVTYDHDTYGNLLILSLAISRQLDKNPKNAEWLFYLGWTKELQSSSGEAFLEDYLEENLKGKHRKKALTLLQQHYEKSYPKGIPEEIKSKLATFSKKL